MAKEKKKKEEVYTVNGANVSKNEFDGLQEKAKSGKIKLTQTGENTYQKKDRMYG